VSEVTGDLLVDDSWFDRALLHPDWPQEQYLGWYMAEIGALSLNDNCLDVTVTGGRHAGEAPAVSWLPRCGLVTVENRARSLAVPRPELDFARGPQDNTIVVKGKIGFGERFTGNVTVHDPGLFFGSALLEVLAGAGIAVRGTVARDPEAGRRDLAKGWTPVAEHRTTLQDAIRVMLKRSQNFYAEMVLKTLGREKGGAGSFEAGARVVTEWLRKSGPAAGAVIVDGSGLSKRNRLSAATLTGVLRRALDGGFLKELVDGLPASGEDGTLEKRLRSDSYRGRVRAKTGWVGGASALSGYVVRGEGDVLVFSMLMNGFSGGNSAAKAVQDRVLVALLGGRGAREDSPGGGRPHSR
jgi:D-alanyl-D-alanine carboxypeptidase/D-alanyl-D-alanine-endopeptidase (penicillin-binding protein 4)